MPSSDPALEPFYAVYGGGGCGRGIMPFARETFASLGKSNCMPDGQRPGRLVFIDDGVTASVLNGHRVMSYAAFLKVPASERHVAIGIANGLSREKVATRLALDGVKAWSATARNAIIMDDVEIGEGALLSPFVTITSNVRIGRQFHANLYSYIEHDCVVGDYVTLAPGAKVNGNIVLEDHVYVGAGAVIRQGRPGAPMVIGRGAVIGMGAIVTRSVAPGTTVAGNPARRLEHRT